MVSLRQVKAELFRALGNPVRIRVLELRRDGPRSVRHLSADIAIDISRMSRQPAILCGAGFVSTRRGGNTVEYSSSVFEVDALLVAARHVWLSVKENVSPSCEWSARRGDSWHPQVRT